MGFSPTNIRVSGRVIDAASGQQLQLSSDLQLFELLDGIHHHKGRRERLIDVSGSSDSGMLGMSGMSPSSSASSATKSMSSCMSSCMLNLGDCYAGSVVRKRIRIRNPHLVPVKLNLKARSTKPQHPSSTRHLTTRHHTTPH